MSSPLPKRDAIAYLQAARWILSDPDKFYSGVGCVKANGDVVTYVDEGVVRFDLIGAIAKVCGAAVGTRYRMVTAHVRRELGLPIDRHPRLAVWLNERKRTQEEVLAVLDRTIATLGGVGEAQGE